MVSINRMVTRNVVPFSKDSKRIFILIACAAVAFVQPNAHTTLAIIACRQTIFFNGQKALLPVIVTFMLLLNLN